MGGAPPFFFCMGGGKGGRRMKIQSLAYFVALVEAGSISSAARQLYLSQPSLTKTLHQMEEELGFPLVVRSSGGVRPTEQGRRVFAEAKQIVEMYNGWKGMARPAALQRIDIYTYISFPDFLLPDIVLGLRKAWPGLEVNITLSERPQRFLSRSGSKPVLALVMCQDQAELDILTRIQGTPPAVLLRGAYRCLVNTRHPLAGQASVTPEQLRRYYLILPNLKDEGLADDDSGGFLHRLLVECTRPDHTVEVETVSNVIPLVEKDDESWALSYWPACRRYPGVQEGRLVSVPIQCPACEGIFALCYSQKAYDRHPAVRQLADSIRRSAREFLARYVPGDPPVP